MSYLILNTEKDDSFTQMSRKAMSIAEGNQVQVVFEYNGINICTYEI